MRDSNPRKRSQSPVCYRYTNPLYAERLYYIQFFQNVKGEKEIIYIEKKKGECGKNLEEMLEDAAVLA